MADRISCCVPFCRRTTKAGFKEWVCCNHWRYVPRSLKTEYNSEKRQARKIIARKPLYSEWWKLPPGSTERLAALGMWRRIDAIWDRCKNAAIERAAGI